MNKVGELIVDTIFTAGSLEYQLVVTPTGTSTGDFGEITVENIDATSAKVYNSGLAGLPFDFIVLV